jgi:hypothetical protein
VKAHILSSTRLKTSFARSVELYTDFIKETNSEAPRNVYEVQTRERGKGGKGNDNVKGNGGGGGGGCDIHVGGGGSPNSKRKAPEMEDEFYSRYSYMALLEDRKDELRQKRSDLSHVQIKK